MRLSTRLIVAMVALVLVTATAVGMLTYRNIEAIALPGALDRIEMHTRILATELEAPLVAARADVNTQGRAIGGLVRASLSGGRDPLDGTPEAQWRNALASRFVAELTAKPAYARFGLVGIADGGREIVRVDRQGPGGTIRVRPDAELQRLGDRPYFNTIIGLPAGEVYVSLVNAEPQQNATGTPDAPTCGSPLRSSPPTPGRLVSSASPSICVPHSPAFWRPVPVTARSTSSMSEATISLPAMTAAHPAPTPAGPRAFRMSFRRSRRRSPPATGARASFPIGRGSDSELQLLGCGWRKVAASM
jgi:hypothetical protein